MKKDYKALVEKLRAMQKTSEAMAEIVGYAKENADLFRDAADAIEFLSADHDDPRNWM